MAIGETEKEFQIKLEKKYKKKEVGSIVIDFFHFIIYSQRSYIIIK